MNSLDRSSHPGVAIFDGYRDMAFQPEKTGQARRGMRRDDWMIVSLLAS